MTKLHLKIQDRINSLFPSKNVKSFKKRRIEDSFDENIILFTQETVEEAVHWKPNFQLNTPEYSENFKLILSHASMLKGGHQFVLEANYNLTRILHDSFSSLLKTIKFGHTFIFKWPLDVFFFQESAGLKISTLTKIKETSTGEDWELHLRAKKDKSCVLGYLLKVFHVSFYIQPAEIKRVIDDRAFTLLKARKLPLILDLDDTLVRVVDKTGSNKVFPESKLHLGKMDCIKVLVSKRVRGLKDGRKVVLGSKVLEFLKWAKQFFEISICSLGDLDYINQVVQVLDPQKLYIKGVIYSARDEYLYLNNNQIDKASGARQAPKDVRALYPFCEFDSPFTLDPIIVDDSVNMWIPQQRDSVIV